MSEPENFLDRWSRRKRGADDEPAPAKDASKQTPKQASTDGAAAPDGAAKAPPAEPAFDPASLPPIESITKETDIRAFLAPGVPPALTRAALRRAWSADPGIRDFIGLVENGWNFNDPYGVPGFGPMPAGEDISRLLAQAIGSPRQPTEAAARPSPSAAPESPNAAEMSHAADLAAAPQQLLQDQAAPEQVQASLEPERVQRNEEDIALQNIRDKADNSATSRPRGHGGALPK